MVYGFQAGHEYKHTKLNTTDEYVIKRIMEISCACYKSSELESALKMLA